MVTFQGHLYNLILTDHALARMILRNVTMDQLIAVLTIGFAIEKPHQTSAFWVFAELKERSDNLVCLSIVIEDRDLILKTVLVNWRPR
jgi:hypothetical protein